MAASHIIAIVKHLGPAAALRGGEANKCE